MTNHPNRRRLPYRVRYGEHEAAFSDPFEAQSFANWSTGRCCSTAEVLLTHGEERGLVSEHKNGRATYHRPAP